MKKKNFKKVPLNKMDKIKGGNNDTQTTTITAGSVRIIRSNFSHVETEISSDIEMEINL